MTETKASKATMADVAKRAGVSPATVARVIYANGYVTDAKRSIVQAAVEAVGYRPNVMARALRTNRSSTLGLVLSDDARNAFFTHVAHVIQSEALTRGYTVLTLNHNTNDRAERDGVQRFLDQHVDAVIFCAAYDPGNVRLIADAGIPVVQVEREIATVGPKVMVDSSAGFLQAGLHLKALGHKAVSYLGVRPGIDRSENPPERSVEALRLMAFRTAMREAGLVIENEILVGHYYSAAGTPLVGASAIAPLLDSAMPPTAIICASDVLAAGVLQAINLRGLGVPHDISVIGFDDSFADLLTPPLTTIAQPISDLGATAIRLALAGIDNEGEISDTEIFDTKLIVRQSTATRRLRISGVQ